MCHWYERRGLGPSNMLALRQLKVMHDLEGELWEWMKDHEACWPGP